MNVTTMTMPEAKAKEAVKTYKDHLQRRHDDELDQVMKGLEAMANGHSVIDVHQAFQETGVNGLGQPKLALVRAHTKTVYYDRRRDGSVTFSEVRFPAHNARWSVRHFPAETLHESYRWDDYPKNWRSNGEAIVPLVPAQYQPKFGLQNYHILFEAEWKKTPPVDPILLKHIGGALYAVLAEWDLTPLEQAVLKGRM